MGHDQTPPYRSQPHLVPAIARNSGATARALAKKYRTSPTSIYRHASEQGWTKEALGDSLARKTAAEHAPERAPEYASEAREQSTARFGADAPESLADKDFDAGEEAREIAAALERRALAQAGQALAKGRAGEARQLAALAEQMRKRAGAERAAADKAGARYAPAELGEGDRETLVTDMFAKAAFIAAAMVHAPLTAPAAFLNLIADWRRINLGEGEADAHARAEVIVAAQAAYLNGDWLALMPDLVRTRFERDWAARAARMQAQASPQE